MITCKFCGNENNDNASTCYICGKSLASGRINSLVGLNENEQPTRQTTYHSVSDNLPYGANAQTAARFQSDTGGGVRSGPTQETFGAQMMSGKTEKKSAGANIIPAIMLLVIVALIVWYCFFSPNAPLA